MQHFCNFMSERISYIHYMYIIFVEMAETSSQVDAFRENAPDDERSLLERRGMYIGICELKIQQLLFCHTPFES